MANRMGFNCFFPPLGKKGACLGARKGEGWTTMGSVLWGNYIWGWQKWWCQIEWGPTLMDLMGLMRKEGIGDGSRSRGTSHFRNHTEHSLRKSTKDFELGLTKHEKQDNEEPGDVPSSLKLAQLLQPWWYPQPWDPYLKFQLQTLIKPHNSPQTATPVSTLEGCVCKATEVGILSALEHLGK